MDGGFTNRGFPWPIHSIKLKMPTLRNAVTEARQRGQAAHEGLKEVAHRASESHHFAIQDGATDGDIHRAIEDVEKLHTLLILIRY